jgi:hypothetical protein
LVRCLAVALSAVLTLAAGCGGNETTDRVAGLTADEILSQSTAAAADLTAFRLAADATIAADVAPGTLPKLVEQALSDPVAISGQGPVNGDDASFDLDAEIPGLPRLQANLTKVGGELFVGVLLTDYKVDLPEEQVASVVPGRLPAGLMAWATEPREAGRETVDGVETVHLAAQIDPARAFADLAPLLQAIQGAPLPAATQKQLAGALATRTMDLWIGIDDLLPRRIHTKLDYAGGVAAVRALRSANLDLDLRLSKLGEEVPITAPATTEVLDLARLQALAGG